jgi:ribosomal-protein-alanine N-acetyltransferase
MTVRIEPLLPADIARCVQLEQELFAGDDPWSARAFVAELASAHNRYFAARDEEHGMLGYAGIALLGPDSDPEYEVHTIAVDPAAQGRGIGAMLLRTLLEVGETRGGPVYLEVRTDNESAIALYRRFGFDIVGLRPSYYQPSGADAYTMCRPAGAGKVVS